MASQMRKLLICGFEILILFPKLFTKENFKSASRTPPHLSLLGTQAALQSRMTKRKGNKL